MREFLYVFFREREREREIEREGEEIYVLE